MSQLPVMVEVPVNHEAVRPMSQRLRERLTAEPTPRPTEELLAKSARGTTLREAHLDSVRARAAQVSQRVESASAKKANMANEKSARIMDKIQTARAKSEAKLLQQQEKREASVARRAQLATAASMKRAMKTRIQEVGADHSEEVQAITRRCESEDAAPSTPTNISPLSVRDGPFGIGASAPSPSPFCKKLLSFGALDGGEKVMRSFERNMYSYSPTKYGRKVACYQIVWGDGSRREVVM